MHSNQLILVCLFKRSTYKHNNYAQTIYFLSSECVKVKKNLQKGNKQENYQRLRGNFLLFISTKTKHNEKAKFLTLYNNGWAWPSGHFYRVSIVHRLQLTTKNLRKWMCSHFTLQCKREPRSI